MRIDLRKLREPLAADIRGSLLAFCSEYPNTQICTVGLFGDGFHGRASLYLDTPDHSSASVQEYAKYGPAWYGEDDQGRFCNSPCDFPHCIGEYKFPGYPNLYKTELDAAVDYVTLDGAKERAEADEGDEGNNRIVFPFLRTVLASFQPFAQLSRVAPFRVGLRMHDSRLLEFWNVEIGKGSI